MIQLEVADPMLAIILLAALLAAYSLGRFVIAWLDSRSLRRQEELEHMTWRQMR